jgi:phosphate transport system substrate-binding protein
MKDAAPERGHEEKPPVTIPTSKRLGALAFAAAIAFSACSSTGSSSAPSTVAGTTAPTTAGGSTAPSTAPASAGAASGEVTISGSSTVQPISEGVKEAFNATNPDVAVSVDGPGTGDGFKLFCKGETDISDASRKIKDEEKKLCSDAGIDFVELKIAIDGMSILTSTKDTVAPACLSFADLYALVGPESEGFKNWKDAQALATELKSATAFPDAPLTISGPGEESGTYDYFVESIVTPIATARTKDPNTRKDYQSSPNDNVIVEGIAGSDTSLGWVGYAYAEENLDKVKFIQVSKDPGGACVEPTKETIADNSYPLSRGLYIYVNKAKAASNPAVAAFVDFYLSDGVITTVNDTVGYIDLAPDVLAQSLAAWQGR